MNVLTRPAGKLIAVTGIDGAGKTTLAASLHAALGHSGHNAILVGKHTTEIPADTDLSEYADKLNAVVYRPKASVSAACGDYYTVAHWRSWLRRSRYQGRPGNGRAVRARPQAAGLPADRNARRGADHVVAGIRRRRPELGLPVHLDPGCCVYL